MIEFNEHKYINHSVALKFKNDWFVQIFKRNLYHATFVNFTKCFGWNQEKFNYDIEIYFNCDLTFGGKYSNNSNGGQYSNKSFQDLSTEGIFEIGNFISNLNFNNCVEELNKIKIPSNLLKHKQNYSYR